MPNLLATAATSGYPVKPRRVPLLISLAKEKLDGLFETESPLLHCNSRFRAMRAERQRSIRLLVAEMIGAGCLQYEAAPCKVTRGPTGKEARPLTVPELARRARISLRTAERCLQDLRESGMMTSLPQIRRRDGMGMLVAPKLRNFTEIFWRALGLWSLYVESVRYAVTEQAPIRLRLFMTRIGSRFSLKKSRHKIVPMEIQKAALACLDAKGSCDAPGDSEVCRHCREARGLT